MERAAGVDENRLLLGGLEKDIDVGPLPTQAGEVLDENEGDLVAFHPHQQVEIAVSTSGGRTGQLSFAKALSGSLDGRPCVSGGLETLETGTRPEVRAARRRPYPEGTRFFGAPRTIRKDDGSSRREPGREDWPV